MKYTLSKAYPILGAVLSFDSASDEKATYDAQVTVDLHDGAADNKGVYTLSWAKESQALTNNDGYVNLYQRVDNPHNTASVDFTIKGGAGVWEKIWGFSLVVEAEH